MRDALEVPCKVKKIADAVFEARSLENAAPVAGAAETAEVAGEEIEAEVGAGGEVLTPLGHAIKGGLGALGLFAGGVEAFYGGKEIGDGHGLAGSADLAGGALNLAAGASQVSASASDSLAAAFKAVGATDAIGCEVPVAGPLVGAASLVTGGVQVYESLEHGKTGEAVSGGIKAVGGGVMVAGAWLDATIVGAPAGVVLDGMGGALILGATAWEHRQAIGRGLAWAGRHISGETAALGRKVGL